MGQDWLQHLMDPCNADTHAKILLLFWRCWFLHDDCIHAAGKESVSRSVAFLVKYAEEIRNDGAIMSLGTGKSSPPSFHNTDETASPSEGIWEAPALGVIKLNSDAAYLVESRCTWAGAVARDHQG